MYNKTFAFESSFKKSLSLLVLFLLLLGGLVANAYYYYQTQQRLAQRQEELRNLQSDVSRLQQQIATAKSKLDQLRQALSGKVLVTESNFNLFLTDLIKMAQEHGLTVKTIQRQKETTTKKKRKKNKSKGLKKVLLTIEGSNEDAVYRFLIILKNHYLLSYTTKTRVSVPVSVVELEVPIFDEKEIKKLKKVLDAEEKKAR